MDLARNEDIIIFVETMKNIYDEYVRVGFTEEQALELLKVHLEVTFKHGGKNN